MSQQILSRFLVFNLLQKFTQNFPSYQLSMRFFKTCKSRAGISRYIISSFFPSFLIVKAVCTEEMTLHSKLIVEADQLYDAALYEELYSVLNAHRISNDPEILWRVARAIFEKCRTIKGDKEKLLNLEEALELVNKALQISENCGAAHKWRAILLDYVWREKSTKGRIIHSFDTKKHMERAIELNPKDSTSYYLLGEWCFTFADMPWYQRKVADAIFASPPTSTYEEALQFFEKAEKTSPLFYSMNLLMLGKCHLRLNNKEQGIAYLTKVLEYPIKTSDDNQAHEEAKKLLKDMKTA